MVYAVVTVNVWANADNVASDWKGMLGTVQGDRVVMSQLKMNNAHTSPELVPWGSLVVVNRKRSPLYG